MSRLTAIAIVTLTVTTWPTSDLAANPNTRDLDAPLAVFGDEPSATLWKEAATIDAKAATELQRYLELKENPQRLNGRALGEVSKGLRTLQRLAAQLLIRGEPAGSDFERRRAAMANDLADIVKVFVETPAGQKFVRAANQGLAGQARARTRTVEKIDRLTKAEEWQQAEDALEDALDGIAMYAPFVQPAALRAANDPFQRYRALIKQNMDTQRKQAAREQLRSSFDSALPKYKEHLEKWAAAASQGTSGSQLVEEITNVWRQAHVATLRCKALGWPLNDPQPDRTLPDVATEYEQFSQAVRDTLVQVIDADAGRLTGPEAARQYGEYVKALPPLVREIGDPTFTEALDVALKKLVAKDEQVAQTVAAYDTATSELLRWRRRVAASAAASKAAEYEPVEVKFHTAARTDASFQGLLPADGQQGEVLIRTPSSRLMSPLNERLAKAKITMTDVFQPQPDSKLATSRYTAMGTYCNLAVRYDLTQPVADLKADLFVGEGTPPLTLAAAMAIDSAERGHLAAAGGDVVGVHLEAVITRLAKLTDAASVLVPLGQLPHAKQRRFKHQTRMLMRFDVLPAWVQHDYFFVDLAN